MDMTDSNMVESVLRHCGPEPGFEPAEDTKTSLLFYCRLFILTALTCCVSCRHPHLKQSEPLMGCGSLWLSCETAVFTRDHEITRLELQAGSDQQRWQRRLRPRWKAGNYSSRQRFEGVSSLKSLAWTSNRPQPYALPYMWQVTRRCIALSK
jgi:hypothetical protein